MILLGLIIMQVASPADLLQEAWKQVDHARTLTVVEVKTKEEFPHEVRTRYWIKVGGYFKAKSGTLFDVSSPDGAWTYDTLKHIYQKRPPIPSNFNLMNALNLDMFSVDWPPIGQASGLVWHGHHATRIECDGRRLTKETKLFLFIDPQTHLPIGISANLGSMTQVDIYEDLRVNPKLSDEEFTFKPPQGWKEVTAQTGGWQ